MTDNESISAAFDSGIKEGKQQVIDDLFQDSSTLNPSGDYFCFDNNGCFVNGWRELPHRKRHVNYLYIDTKKMNELIELYKKEKAKKEN